MILVRASESTLMGMNVENASRAKSESRKVQHMSPLSAKARAHTLFANLEQLISFPCNHTAGQSAPAPFHHTGQNLSI
jgi:hypothetical protein